MTGIRRLVAIVLIGAMSPFAFGCYGAFPLTHIVYKLNGDIKPGLLSQIVFWVFVILPVYSIAMLADAVVLQPGRVLDGRRRSTSRPHRARTAPPTRSPRPTDGREAVLTVSRGQMPSTRGPVRAAGRAAWSRCATRTAGWPGHVVPDGAGGFRLTDAAGATVSTISAADLPSLAALGAR